jgi:hypothetical protein
MSNDIAQRFAPRAVRLPDTTQHDPRGPDRAHFGSSSPQAFLAFFIDLRFSAEMQSET